jgi:hypothetical protein
MEKIDMREWVAALEDVVDNKLNKWKKEPKMENGEAVQLRWTWEQTHIHIDIFWMDGHESLNLQYLSPRIDHHYRWHGLDDRSFNNVMDRVGNLAQVTMHPPIDYMDK